MYEGLKHFHMLTIALSATLLSVRYGLMMADSKLLNNPVLKRFPHINDTLLLLSGFGLMYITGFSPLSPNGAWLMEKFTCILAYIALGFFALKLGRNKLLRTFSFLGALGWLIMAAKVALTKTPIFLG
ncbi:SirB2 family protein [Vibrio sp. 10N.261.55.A7]|uniref:SirB2 family protein n=1 Tax=Vibrio TaxID=662 RepID=UPI000915DFB3|nr:SirB2 family protein [Vibrio sp. 10N.261.55.A7]OIQ25542.1 MAG: hypothetical protein BM561_05585 [Vibrio sp. MedPE-SWchi]PMK04625.1 hypothetical protein BCU12_15955 [Vibrio sp. 10N.261.55.A7]